MRSLGLDLGSVTCGVAISDALGIVARTVEKVRFAEDDYESCLSRILKIIQENEPIGQIVLGLPKHMNGDIGIRGEICIQFKEMLEEKVNIPIILWDERLTTVIAQKTLISADLSRKKRKKVVDQIAAVTILQSYLDKN